MDSTGRLSNLHAGMYVGVAIATLALFANACTAHKPLTPAAAIATGVTIAHDVAIDLGVPTTSPEGALIDVAYWLVCGGCGKATPAKRYVPNYTCPSCKAAALSTSSATSSPLTLEQDLTAGR